MRHRKQFWRFAFSAGSVGTVLTLAAFVASTRWVIGWGFRQQRVFAIGNGLIGFEEIPAPSDLLIFPVKGPFRWWTFKDEVRLSLLVPLWIPLLAFASLTAFAWFRSRQLRLPGRCRSCNYDLTGNVTGKCPECGTEIPRHDAASPQT